MLLFSILVFFIAILLGFSLSKDTGKNTKYARQGTNAIAPESVTRSVDTSNVIEIN